MFPRRKTRRPEKHRMPPVDVTDSFILHFEDIRPTHKSVKVAHHLVYVIGFSLIASSLAFCVCRAV